VLGPPDEHYVPRPGELIELTNHGYDSGYDGLIVRVLAVISAAPSSGCTVAWEPVVPPELPPDLTFRRTSAGPGWAHWAPYEPEDAPL
jgi:hypothetical protein